MAADVGAQPRPIARVAPTIPWRKLVTGGTAIMVGSAASNVLSFLFTLVVARLLKPEAYATVTACLSLLVVGAIPAGTLQLIAARYSAIWWEVDRARAQQLTRWLCRLGLGLGGTVAIGVGLFAGPLDRYLNLNTPLPLLLTALILLGSFLAPVFRGVLQGQHHFTLYAIATTSEFVVRLACGAAFVVAGWHELGALGGVLCGVGAAAAIAWLFGRDRQRLSIRATIPWMSVLRWSIPTFLVQATLAAILFQDTLLAKHFFPPTMAGAYAGLATTARVLVYISGALATILFPVVARMHSTGGQSRLITHMTLGLVAGIQIVLLAVYARVPGLVLHVVVGNQYGAVSPYLPALAVALSAYSIITILSSYLLATANRRFWLPFVATPIVQGVLMTVFHHSLPEFIGAFDVVMLAALALLLAIYLWPGDQQSIREQEVR